MIRHIPALICTTLLTLAFAMGKTSIAQDVDPKIGFDPYGAFQSSKIDNVNVLNGNIVVKIPLLTLPQRGAFKPITYSLINNVMPWTVSSNLDEFGHGSYYIHASGVYNNVPDGVAIKSDAMPYSGANVSLVSFSDASSDPKEALLWSVTDYSGATHPAVYNYNDPSELRTVDGSKFRLKFQNIVLGGVTYSDNYFFAHNYDVGYNIDYTYYPTLNMHNILPDLYDPNGVRTVRVLSGSIGSGLQRIEGGYVDQDGNTMTLPPDASAGTGTDTVGRTLYGGLSFPDYTADISSHCPNLGIPDQQVAYYDIVPLVNTYGTATPDPRYTYTVCRTQIHYRTNFWSSEGGDSPPGEETLGYYEADSSEALFGNNTMGPIQSLVFPDGTYWGFVYDNVTSSKLTATGMLTKVITPEGGSISYCYGSSYPFMSNPNQGAGASLPLLTRRWEQTTVGTNLDACDHATGFPGPPAHTYWSYQIYPWAGAGNTATTPGKVIDPAGNETDYTYGPGGETSETVYVGCASGTSDTECVSGIPGAGTILKATTTGYDTRTIPGPYGDGDYQPQYASYPIATSTSQNGTVVGNTTSDYQGDFKGISWACTVYGAHPPLPPSGCYIPPGSTGVSFLVGQPWHTNTYQGSGTGTLLKAETTTVTASSSGSCGLDPDGNCYWDNNLLNTPSSVTASDSLGNSLTTSYSYDQPSYVAPDSAALLAYNISGLGHLTSTSAGGYTSYRSWNSSGMPTSSVDAISHTTTYTYDITGLNIGTITRPDSEVDTYVFDRTSNQVTEHTDSNGNVTSLAYDVMRRPWTIQYQDAANLSGYSQVACYPNATQVKVYQAQGASALTSSLSTSGLSFSSSSSVAGPSSCPPNTSAIMMTANVDGLGRTISKIARAPEGDIKTDTLYDIVGRAYATSNPYLASGSASAWTVTSAFDALARPLSVYQGSSSTTSPSGDRKQWTYSGLSTTAIDENSNQTKTTTDFLGRVVEVDEPLTSGSSPTTIPTTYTYNLYGLIGVTQSGASGETARTRSFTYDGLGHLTWSTNPETGSICYGAVSGGSCTGGYDGNGNLIKKTDARAVVISYAYDNMNRLTGKTYTGSGIATATLSSCYEYGTSSTSPANSKGRLINEWTKAGACASSLPSGVATQHSILAYDVMGRVVKEKQCSKTLCTASTPPQVSFAYDLGGKMTSYSNGLPGLAGGFSFANQFDSAGRLLSVTSAWDDLTHPGLLWSATGYGPYGPTNADIGRHLSLTKSYDQRIRPATETVIYHP